MASPHIQMDPEEAAVIEALARHMAKILDAFRTFSRVHPRWATAAESPAAEVSTLLQRQLGPSGVWPGDAADYAADAALLFLVAQSDHLAVLQQIYSSYVGLMFGVAPPARSLLELNGYVFWLLHPDVESVRTRASRALLSQLNGATRELSAAKKLGAPGSLRSQRGQVVRELKDRVKAQFYPSEIEYEEPGRRLILRGEKHPGPGEALRHLSVAGAQDWNSEGAYAFLSNASHPTLHAITDTIKQAGKGLPARFGHSDTLYHYRLARISMSCFLSTWQIAAAYRGLDQQPSRQLAREIDDLPQP